MTARTAQRVPAVWFDRLYAEHDDPWGFATSDYERTKYGATLAALGTRRFARALEIGCSIGVLTGGLASRCDSLVAIDVSATALARARERLGDLGHVELLRRTFPEQCPPGPWNLIVCSEVLYYLDVPAFELAVDHLDEALTDGATVLAVHWRPATRTYPLLGDEVHDQLCERLGRWHLQDARTASYRLDRFEGTHAPLS